MPRATGRKRALQEVDPTTARAAPAAKKLTTSEGKPRYVSSERQGFPATKSSSDSRGQTPQGTESNGSIETREDPNVSPASHDEQPSESPSFPSAASDTPQTCRVPKGPNGEPFLPGLLPEECIKIGEKQILLHSWTMFDVHLAAL
jgi:hypothetical protein